jgi:hypothetical protein
MTLWRVRPVTENDQQSRLRKEWMTWDQNDHEVVVTRISDKDPIPNQELIQMTIEYLSDGNARAANRAGYLYVINREQFPGLGIFWFTPTMTETHLVFAIITTLYILVGIKLEERDLEDAHPEYAQYKLKVPALIPSFRRRLRATSRTQSA